MTQEKTIVIGAGPGGASAAIYLARFNQQVTLFDAGKTIRGRTAWAYELENVLGFTKPLPGPDFLHNIDQQLKRFDIDKREETVTAVTKTPEGRFMVNTDKPAHYLADYVIVAVGVHDVMPDAPDVYDYFGKSVFPCAACNWYQTKGCKTAIITNSDMGLITARAFNAMQKGSALCVLPDRPDTAFSRDLVVLAESEGIAVHSSPLICFNGENGKLHSVTLANGANLNLDILYTRLGVKRHDIFLNAETLVVDRDQDGYIKVNFETLESSVPNLFAVGPCNTGPDQIIIAAGQGASAAMVIHDRILTNLGI